MLWGGLHGVYVAINHLWRRAGVQLPAALSWAITFVALMVGWVFFRAPSFQRAQVILAGMLGLNGFAWPHLPDSIGGNRFKLLVLALAVVLWCPNRQAIMQWRWASDYAYAVAFALLAGFSILRLGDPSPFLYFQF